MTRLDLILRFLYKVRAWDASDEEAHANLKKKWSRYVRLSLFDVHTMLLLASREIVTPASTHIGRKEFMRSAETANEDLKALAVKGYVEPHGSGYRLTDEGKRFVNAVIS